MSYKYCFDLHVHTHRSIDSLARLDKLARRAIKLGLAGFAITDHNIAVDHEAVVNTEKQYNLTIIPGIETNTPQGDIIGLFIYDEPPRDHINNAARFIREKDGIVYLPHPGKRCKLEELDTDLLDLVEVFNARCREKQNKFAREYFDKLEIPQAASSDSHLVADLGHAVTCFNSVELSEIKQAIRSGDIKIGKTEYYSRFRVHQSVYINLCKRYGFPAASLIMAGKVIKRLLHLK